MPGAIDPVFSDLLVRLYAGIEDEHPWQRFLEALAVWMDASFATLILTAPGKRAPGTFLTPGASADFAAIYAENLFADDPFRDLPDGEVTSYARFMAGLPDNAFADYREAMRRTGYEQVLGIDLHFGGRARFEARFRLSRQNDLPDFTGEDRARLQALVPHLRIAVGLFEKLQFAGAQHGVFHSAAEGLGLALVVLDRARRIVSSNALADRILAEDEGLRRRGEELAFAAATHQRAVAALLADGEQPGLPTRFRIERPRHGDIVVTARPLDLQAIHAGTGALALFLARPRGVIDGADVARDPQALRQLLGLTTAEARLTMVLAEGFSLVDAARRLGIAHNTAKAQLRAVFAKTGVHRQSQLVALLASMNG